MLTELKLTNFKLFDDEVTIRFRPITVFLGRNNSGKTAVLDFLYLLQHSRYREPTYVQPPAFLEGINHGSHREPFNEMKNSASAKEALSFTLTASIPQGGYSLRQSNPPSYWQVSATAPYSPEPRGGQVQYAALDENKQPIRSWPAVNVNQFGQKTEASEHQTTAAAGEYNALAEIAQRNLNLLVFIRARRQRLFTAVSRHHPGSDARPDPNGCGALNRLRRMATTQNDPWPFWAHHLDLVAGIAELEFRPTERFADYQVDEVSRDCDRAFARTEPGRPEADFSAFGAGTGNVLSILTAGAELERGQTLVAEHPEAGLDPAAQLELGQFFADLWTERQVGSIIETHSDNLLLRLRRLVANGKLNPEAVSIAYFTENSNSRQPLVKNLDINPDGSLSPGLPIEFFGCDVIEAMKMGAGE